MTARERFALERYFDAIKRAEYHRWSAIRGFNRPGNDPMTGKPRKMFDYAERTGADRVANKALARHWLGVARQIRLTGSAARA